MIEPSLCTFGVAQGGKDWRIGLDDMRSAQAVEDVDRRELTAIAAAADRMSDGEPSRIRDVRCEILCWLSLSSDRARYIVNTGTLNEGMNCRQ